MWEVRSVSCIYRHPGKELRKKERRISGNGQRRSKLCDVCAPAQATHSGTITLRSDRPERKGATIQMVALVAILSCYVLYITSKQDSDCPHEERPNTVPEIIPRCSERREIKCFCFACASFFTLSSDSCRWQCRGPFRIGGLENPSARHCHIDKRYALFFRMNEFI